MSVNLTFHLLYIYLTKYPSVFQELLDFKDKLDMCFEKCFGNNEKFSTAIKVLSLSLSHSITSSHSLSQLSKGYIEFLLFKCCKNNETFCRCSLGERKLVRGWTGLKGELEKISFIDLPCIQRVEMKNCLLTKRKFIK